MSGMVKPLTYGRMGNFLFQAAAAMGYALRHGMGYTLPNSTMNPKDNPIYLQHLVRKDFNHALLFRRLDEQTHGFQEIPFEKGWRNGNIILNGYWQSEKYFKEFREQIIQAFGFPWECWAGTVSVHVRRGDYLTLTKKHPPVPKEWIEKAMAEFPGGAFVFFSDDIPWCKETFGHREDVTFSVGDPTFTPSHPLEERDLVAMSCCEHHICSASTFSWWGAWLNQNQDKRIIIPKDWFQPGYRKTDTSDIVPSEWEKLSL